MPTPSQLKALRFVSSKPTGPQPFKERVLAELANAGISLPTDAGAGADAGSHSLLVLTQDGRGTSIWALPNERIDAADRARLDAIHGAYFETMFTADLQPERFGAALVLLVRTKLLTLGGPEDGVYQDIAEAFAAEGAEMPDVDFAAIGGDVWGGRDVTRTGLGGIELTNLYVVQIAM